MSMTSESLIDALYGVCDQCKEGKIATFVSNSEDIVKFEKSAMIGFQDWFEHHKNCVGSIQTGISGRIFLSRYLEDGYIDVDRPDLKPLVINLGGVTLTTGEPNAPGGADRAMGIQRRMRTEHSRPTVPLSKVVETATTPINAPQKRERTLEELIFECILIFARDWSEVWLRALKE